jgi:hypothetical protein
MSLSGSLEQLELQEESVWIIYVCEERNLKPPGTHPTGILGVDVGHWRSADLFNTGQWQQ